MLGVQAHNERTAPSVESGRNDAGHGVVRLAGYVGAKRGALRRSDNFCREGMLLLPLQGDEVVVRQPSQTLLPAVGEDNTLLQSRFRGGRQVNRLRDT